MNAVKLILLVIVLFIFGCKSNKEIDIVTDRNIELDYTNSYDNGFKIYNKGILYSENLKGKFYKIFYQNESYKFNDTLSFSNENFYGSWENTDIGFKEIIDDTTIFEFNIVGNPRNEEKYYHFIECIFIKIQYKI